MKNPFGKNGIILDEKEKLEELFASINGKATSWTVDHEEVTELLEKAEKDLGNRGFTRNEMNGVTVKVTTAGPSTKSYKYTVTANEFKARMSPKGWRILSFDKAGVYPGTPARRSFEVSQEKHDIVVQRALRAINSNLKVKGKEAA